LPKIGFTWTPTARISPFEIASERSAAILELIRRSAACAAVSSASIGLTKISRKSNVVNGNEIGLSELASSNNNSSGPFLTAPASYTVL